MNAIMMKSFESRELLENREQLRTCEMESCFWNFHDAERQNVSRHLVILTEQKKAPNIYSACRTFWDLSSGVTISPQKFFSTLRFIAASGHEQDWQTLFFETESTARQIFGLAL